jgi:predicted ATP-grasp superfamily ATP-dependent carboligase
MPLLVVAVTGRALAASAARGGYRVVVLDLFADRDTAAVAGDCRSVASRHGLRFDRGALLRAAAAMAPSAGLVYGSGFEGRPGLLARLARGRALYGNAPETLAAVRDPVRFFPLLDRLGLDHPEVRLSPPRGTAGWLVKRPGGAGGTQVAPAGARPARAGDYYQRLATGPTLSATFLADGRRACLLGINRQWTAARPGLPFLYGGAVGGVRLPSRLRAEIEAGLDAVVETTGLVGLNGLDFVLAEREWLVLELNPRPTATFELYDPDYPRGLFHRHLRACRGELPPRAARPRAVRAHAVVHAPAGGRDAGLPYPTWCRDLPLPGTCFRPGDPVCTVHASAVNAERALALLRRRHRTMVRALGAAAA